MNRRIRILPLLVAAALPAGFARGDWLYDAAAQRMTELDPPGGGTPWILNCTGSGTDLSVASVQQTGAGAVVDLRLPVRSAGGDAFSVVGLGIDAFRGNLSLEEIRLPDTLVSIGRGAFDGCTALRSVSPFLPDSVASIGVEAFRNVPAGGTLRLGFGGSLAFPPDDRGWNGNEHFKNTAVEEVAIGPGVAAIPWNAFLECQALTNLDLRAATSLSVIGVCSFLNCTALRRVDPLLPDTVASIGAQAFAHDPIEGTLRLGFGGPLDLRDDERGWNVENYFEDTRIGEVQFGPGVVNVKRGFITGNPALSNVVFRTTALTAIGQAAFDGCTALRRVEPLLPDTVVYLGSTAFNNTQVEGSLRIGFGGPVRFGTEFYGQSRLFWVLRPVAPVLGLEDLRGRRGAGRHEHPVLLRLRLQAADERGPAGEEPRRHRGERVLRLLGARGNHVPHVPPVRAVRLRQTAFHGPVLRSGRRPRVAGLARRPGQRDAVGRPPRRRARRILRPVGRPSEPPQVARRRMVRPLPGELVDPALHRQRADRPDREVAPARSAGRARGGPAASRPARRPTSAHSAHYP